jgi:SAM-dependent methyltransferase
MSGQSPLAPSPWVCRVAPLIRPGGRVLDLAAGSGRHTRLLQKLGHAVVAVDRDISALTELADDAAITLVATDLEDGSSWTIGGDFDGVVVTNYLHRPLFPTLRDILAPGGILIYETFMAGNERFGRPSNPAFLLRPGELMDAFGRDLTTIAFEQGIVERPKPAAIQRIAAVKGAPTRLPNPDSRPR